MVATILYENNVAKEPYLRKSLWLNTSSIVTYVNGCLQGVTVSRVLVTLQNNPPATMLTIPTS